MSPSIRKWENESLLDTIIEHARKGNSRTDSFAVAGIHPDTGFDWLAMARKDPDRYPALVEFAERLRLAEAEFRAECVEKVREHAQSGAPNTWQAAMTLLERRDPENWGKREKTQIEIEGDKPLIQLNQVVLLDEQTRALSREVLRRVTSGSFAPLELDAGEIEVEEIEDADA